MDRQGIIMGIEKKNRTYEESLYKLIKEYTASDIERIIDAKVQAAGLIIIPAFVGMIGLGQCLYGFDLDKRAAFLKFARYRMKLDRSLAEILYDNVYGGLIHQWCSESRIILHSRFDPLYVGSFWYRCRSEDPQQVHISAKAIALAYTEAVDKLPEYSKTPQYPSVNPEAVRIIRDQVEAFCSVSKVQSGGAVWQYVE